MKRLLAAVSAAGLLALTGCTGVPTSSQPQVLKSVNLNRPSAATAITPTPGANPREIVQEFLSANVSQDKRYSAARTFLTPAAKNRWTDTTVTIVNTLQIGNFDIGDDTVTVRGGTVGTVSSTGVYAPVLQGDGSGGPILPFGFVMKQIGGQWRIDSLPPGLLLAESDFQQIYQQHNLYYYDLTGTHLIPDPRYTALADPAALASWLVQQLVSGPGPELQNVVGSDIPAQTDPRRVSLTMGQVTQIEIPGASQLDPGTLNHLAAQVAVTLGEVDGGQSLTITDGGRPVRIPLVGGVGFTESMFVPVPDPARPPPPLYYIRDAGHHGAVVTEQGTPLPGPLGTGQYDLTSVALARDGGSDLYAAGTTGTRADSRLLVGTQSHGLLPTAVHGALTRPSWAPGLDEVWVGAGSTIWRVSGAGTATAVSVTPASGVVAGQVIALRISPDGARVAVVLRGAANVAQLWVGAVVRPIAGQVRIDNLEQISPQAISITDVAWYGAVKLFATGHSVISGAANVYEVQVDGSVWTARNIINLPDAPDSITVAENAFAWVSAGGPGGTIWEQAAGSWTSPGGTYTYGSNPVYLE